jgi:hypothetical protein
LQFIAKGMSTFDAIQEEGGDIKTNYRRIKCIDTSSVRIKIKDENWK